MSSSDPRSARRLEAAGKHGQFPWNTTSCMGALRPNGFATTGKHVGASGRPSCKSKATVHAGDATSLCFRASAWRNSIGVDPVTRRRVGSTGVACASARSSGLWCLPEPLADGCSPLPGDGAPWRAFTRRFSGSRPSPASLWPEDLPCDGSDDRPCGEQTCCEPGWRSAIGSLRRRRKTPASRCRLPHRGEQQGPPARPVAVDWMALTAVRGSGVVLRGQSSLA